MRHKIFPRAAGASLDHRPSSKAFLAAFTALSMSLLCPAAILVITAPSIGDITSTWAPSRASVFLPSIRCCPIDIGDFRKLLISD